MSEAPNPDPAPDPDWLDQVIPNTDPPIRYRDAIKAVNVDEFLKQFNAGVQYALRELTNYARKAQSINYIIHSEPPIEDTPE